MAVQEPPMRAGSFFASCLCTDLNLSLLYILMLGTYSKFEDHVWLQSLGFLPPLTQTHTSVKIFLLKMGVCECICVCVCLSL